MSKSPNGSEKRCQKYRIGSRRDSTVLIPQIPAHNTYGLRLKGPLIIHREEASRHGPTTAKLDPRGCGQHGSRPMLAVAPNRFEAEGLNELCHVQDEDHCHSGKDWGVSGPTGGDFTPCLQTRHHCPGTRTFTPKSCGGEVVSKSHRTAETAPWLLYLMTMSKEQRG